MRRALRVIDMLEDFVDEAGALRVPDTAKILPRLAEEVWEARCRGSP